MKPARTKRTWLWLLLLVVCVISGLSLNYAARKMTGIAQDPEKFRQAILQDDYLFAYWLLKFGADVGADVISTDGFGDFDMTPIMLAAKSASNPKIVELLIKNGADVHTGNKEFGKTPLMLAASFSSTPEIVSLLIEKGADVNARDNYGFTPLMGAFGSSSSPEIVSLLIEKGADVNAREEMGWTTALMIAAGNSQNPGTIALLIEKGAEVDAKDNTGMTPLMWAAGMSSVPEIVQLLLDNGADVNAKNFGGSTPLMLAAGKYSTPEIVELRLDAASRFNPRAKYDRTLLAKKTAHYSKTPKFVSLLLEKGADVMVKDAYGKKAIDYAKENEKLKDTAVYQRLLEMSESSP